MLSEPEVFDLRIVSEGTTAAGQLGAIFLSTLFPEHDSLFFSQNNK